MAINLTEDINHSAGGKIVSVAQSQGSWQSIATKATFDSAFLATAEQKQNLSNGQFFYVLNENQLYKLTVSGFGPFATYTLNSASFGEGIDTGSFLTADDTGSFVLISQTSSFLTIDDTGSFLTSADTSSFVLVSQTSSFLTTADTGSFLTSADTSSFVLISQTSSMEVSASIFADTASYIDPTFISASAAASGFGAGGGSNLDTSSFITNDQTGSFLTSEDTSSFITNDQTSSMSVATASFAFTASYAQDLTIGGGISGSGWEISSDGVLTLGTVGSEPPSTPGSIWFDGTNFYFNV